MSFGKWTPASRLTAISVAMLTLVAVFFCSIAFVQAWEVLKNEAFGKLTALAAANRREVNGLLDSYVQLVSVGQQGRIASDLLQYSASDKRDPSAIDSLRSFLIKSTAGSRDAPRVDFTDAQGKVILSTDKSREGTDLSNDPDFQAGKRSLGIRGMRSENGGIFLYLAGPVSDNQGMVKAVILERYPASKILGVTGDYSGLGETGENLIGQRVGDHILFLTPRRFEAKLPSQGPVSITKGIALPMVHATAGQTGVIIGPDYRGMTTIAAYAPLGVQGWGLVVKQDKTEVFSKLDRYGVLLIISVVLLAVTGASIIVPLASALTKPAEEPAGKTEAPGKPQAP